MDHTLQRGGFGCFSCDIHTSAGWIVLQVFSCGNVIFYMDFSDKVVCGECGCFAKCSSLRMVMRVEKVSVVRCTASLDAANSYPKRNN